MAQITTDEQGRFKFIAPKGKKLTLKITDPMLPHYPITHDLGKCTQSLHILRNIDDAIYEETKSVGNWVVVDAAREFPKDPNFDPGEKTLRNYISDAFAVVRDKLSKADGIHYYVPIPTGASDIQDYQMIWESPDDNPPDLNSHVLIPYPYDTSPTKNEYYIAILGVVDNQYDVVYADFIQKDQLVNDGIIIGTSYGTHAIIAVGWVSKTGCRCTVSSVAGSQKAICVREANSWADAVYAQVCPTCGARYNAYDTPPLECDLQGHLVSEEYYNSVFSSRTTQSPINSNQAKCIVCEMTRVMMEKTCEKTNCYHSYTPWEIIQAPTATETGIAQMHCMRCKMYWRKIIPATET